VFRKTWGEAVVGNAGLSLIFGLAALLGVVPLVLGFLALPWGIVVGGAIALVYWLALTVIDNGDGFDPAANAMGHGLASMGRRARAMGGTWEIASQQGQGTRIELRVSIGRRGRPDNSTSDKH